MAIQNYSTLLTAIGSWTHRTDMTTMGDDFITLTESWINRDLLVSESEIILSISASTSPISLPSDFVSARKINLQTSPVRELQYITPTEMDILDDNGSDLSYYTIVGDELKLQATSSYDIEIVYRAKLTALSNTNSTNWLITKHPDVYLYGVLAAAYIYAQDFEQSQIYVDLFRSALASINSIDNDRKYGNSLSVRVG